MTPDEREQFLKRVAQHNLAADKSLSEWPSVGEVWQHYKGGIYDVIALAVHESELTPLVIYRSQQYGYVWARPLAQWLEMVNVDGRQMPRFALILEDDSPPRLPPEQEAERQRLWQQYLNDPGDDVWEEKQP